jgi:hypothetical protein
MSDSGTKDSTKVAYEGDGHDLKHAAEILASYAQTQYDEMWQIGIRYKKMVKMK